MKALATALLLTATAFAASSLQEAAPSPHESTAEHEWLLQFVGDWQASSEAVMAPGEEPTRWESTEHIRAIGDLWIVSEGSATTDGEAFASMMTIGFDSDRAAFVGSWVDSMQSTMWSYRGTLDDAKRVLTLEAEGPSFTDPSKTSRYRDQLELIDSDHKRMTSSALGEDGVWLTFMTMDARRKK